jgi:hypothetical protein
VSVVDTDGGHITMLASPHADATAQALSRRLPGGAPHGALTAGIV